MKRVQDTFKGAVLDSKMAAAQAAAEEASAGSKNVEKAVKQIANMAKNKVFTPILGDGKAPGFFAGMNFGGKKKLLG